MPRVSFDSKRHDSHVKSPAEEPPPPPIEVLFDVARDKYRRAILQYLDGITENVVDVADLVAHVHATTSGDTSESPSEEPRESGALELETLHHYHLPLLDAAGLITYDILQQEVHYQKQPMVAGLLAFSRRYTERNEEATSP
ncbi:DUF7344 domain-containing protein [Haladaptatus sp. DFWS20]|uniref:DUF7344 domain-containing protein n=1 Tax=Haladaptatus sp. DFWS20 TaxID=3403467 RepID=UPI003EBB3996